MLGKPNKQKDFFDSYVYENLLPAEHILLDINKHIDFSFVEEETKDLYSSQLGRPSYPPEVLFKMLFLEFYYTLSDVEVAKQCKYNILYRYFTGLQIHDPTPDDTSLVIFRDRLGKERFDRLFSRIVLQAKEKNLLKERLKIVDSTKVIADVLIPNKVNLLHQGRKLITKAISKLNPKKAQELTEKYLRKTKLFTKPAKKEIQKERKLTRQFIKTVKTKFGKNIDNLSNLLNSASWGRKKKDKLASFIDPDARFGKTKIGPEGNFCGYKAHISEDESEIITSVDTLKGNKDEGSNLKPLLEMDKEKEITHKATVADAKYDSAKNRRDIHHRKMRAYIPSGRGSKKYIDNFLYDKTTDTAICQEGYLPISKARQENGYLYIFPARSCKNCKNKRAPCPKPNAGRIRLFISDDHKLKLLDNTPERKEAITLRKGIERKFGEAKKWHGMSRARYRTKWKVAIQILMTFLVINAKRMARLLKERPPARVFRPALAIRAG